MFAVGLDGKNFHRISKEDGTHGPNFGPAKTKSYVDTYSALTTPPRMSLCSTDGACNPFWQSRSVEAYGLIADQAGGVHRGGRKDEAVGYAAAARGRADDGQRQGAPHLNPYGGPGAQIRA